MLYRILLLAGCQQICAARLTTSNALFGPIFQQLQARHESALTYLLRVNPLAVMANLDCNLETGDRSAAPASQWGGGAAGQ